MRHRRPLTVLALLFASGTALGLAMPQTGRFDAVVLAFAILVWCGALLLALLRKDFQAQLVALLLVVFVGMLSALLPRTGVSLASVLPLAPDARVSATISGAIARIPDRPEESPVLLLLQVQEIVVDGQHLHVHETIPVLVYGKFDWSQKKWEHWSFEGTLRYRPDDHRGAWFFVTGVSGAKRQGPPTATLTVWSEQMRRLAAETLQAGVEEEQDIYGVVHALLLGYRARLPSAVEEAFRSTGTMHVFAISGLHVSIICAVLVFLTNLLRVPRTCRVLALAPVIVLYAFMTGARASAVRAGVMAVTYLAAPLFGRRSEPWSALALASILILAWRPDQLFDPGFIFSFTAVAGILAFVPLAEGWLQGHLPVDPFQERDQGPGIWATILLWLGRLVAVSVAAWVSTTPLSLYYFGRFAPIALLSNLIVLPLAFLIVVTGCLSLLAAAIGGMGFAVVFNLANLVYVQGLTSGMRWLQRVPWGHAEHVFVPLPGVVLWYAMLVVIAILLYRRRRAASDQSAPFAFGL